MPIQWGLTEHPRDEVAMEETKAEKFKMLRASRSPAAVPVKPIYVTIKGLYPDIDGLARFVIQNYCNGRLDSVGQCADQVEMTPNGEKRGRAYITSKEGDNQHEILVRYLSWMSDNFAPSMHVREAGEFGAGFSVVRWPMETPRSIGGPRFGVCKTKGYRTKIHTDYDAGRGTSYFACAAMSDGVFGILMNGMGEEQIIKLAKGETYNYAIISLKTIKAQ